MHNDDEWGNIELPGVSDEDLYNSNVYRSIRLKNLWKNGKMHEIICSEEQRKIRSKNTKEFFDNNPDKALVQVDKMLNATQKAVITPYGEFISRAAFEREITHSSFARKTQSMPHLYYFVEDGPGNPTYQQVCYTPYGVAPKTTHGYNLNSLFMLAKQNNDINAQCKSCGDWFKKMCRNDPENYYVKTEPKREWALEEKNDE